MRVAVGTAPHAAFVPLRISCRVPLVRLSVTLLTLIAQGYQGGRAHFLVGAGDEICVGLQGDVSKGRQSGHRSQRLSGQCDRVGITGRNGGALPYNITGKEKKQCRAEKNYQIVWGFESLRHGGLLIIRREMERGTITRDGLNMPCSTLAKVICQRHISNILDINRFIFVLVIMS